MTTSQKREILTPSEVADRFKVDPKTVTRWAKAGKISYFVTLGGHRRYYLDEIEVATTNVQTATRLDDGGAE